MRRDDLRVLVSDTTDDSGRHRVQVFRPVSDADLATLGYVKLDGIDTEALRDSVRQWDQRIVPGRMGSPPGVYALEVARKVLAAIDQEDTDG